jgi:hypothetical protein
MRNAGTIVVYTIGVLPTYLFVHAYDLLDPAVCAACWPLYWIARIVSLAFGG